MPARRRRSSVAVHALFVMQPETRESCCEKYKLIFSTRNRTDAGAVQAIIELFESTPSGLLRHEIAYALGQMQKPEAIPFLSRLLTDRTEDSIVRHEAAEALGALGAPESLELLRQYASDGAAEVAETCELAIARLDFQLNKGACGCEKRPFEVVRLEAEAEAREAAAKAAPGSETTAAQASPPDGFAVASIAELIGDGEICNNPPPPPADDGAEAPASFVSVDPAPPAAAASVEVLRAQLLDAGLPLFDRYRALFALRDASEKGDPEPAVRAICDAFDDEPCALFKHEVAFVLGQVEHAASTEALCKVMRSDEEHPMVRHEAAEALGAIASDEAMQLLREYARPPCRAHAPHCLAFCPLLIPSVPPQVRRPPRRDPARVMLGRAPHVRQGGIPRGWRRRLTCALWRVAASHARAPALCSSRAHLWPARSRGREVGEREGGARLASARRHIHHGDSRAQYSAEL